MREELRSGLDYLEAITALVQRVRNAHPTYGLYQAAEFQWWWTIPRPTDDLDQLFWFDDDGQPAAAFTVVDFGDGSSALYENPTLVVTVLPGSTSDWITQVVERGLSHIAENGLSTVELEVDRVDTAMIELLAGHGFTRQSDGIVEAWLDADTRPEVSPLHDGYRLLSRSESASRPHHMADPRRPDIEQRMQQVSLYDPNLDLVVLGPEDDVAGYGLFWYDAETRTGVVEPMRTADAHQRRGLARHILTAGIDLLATAGATRISIGYEPGNEASGPLYRSVGFEPHLQSDVYARTVDNS